MLKCSLEQWSPPSGITVISYNHNQNAKHLAHCGYSGKRRGKVLTVIMLGGVSLSRLCLLFTEGLRIISLKVSTVLFYLLSLFCFILSLVLDEGSGWVTQDEKSVAANTVWLHREVSGSRKTDEVGLDLHIMNFIPVHKCTVGGLTSQSQTLKVQLIHFYLRCKKAI